LSRGGGLEAEASALQWIWEDVIGRDLLMHHVDKQDQNSYICHFPCMSSNTSTSTTTITTTTEQPAKEQQQQE
jgi:hypothetical protein